MFPKSIKWIRFIFILSALTWSVIWKNTTTHYLGDTLISEWFYFAGQTFAKNGIFYKYGLSIYSVGAQPYTHIPPGPEWLQMFVAKVQLLLFKQNSYFTVHAILTAILSIAMMAWSFVLSKQIVLKNFKLSSEEKNNADQIWNLIFLFAIGSATVQVFSPNPYVFGTEFAVVVAIFALSLLLKYQAKALCWFGASAFVFLNSFWMGLTTLPMLVLFYIACVFIFDSEIKIKNRVIIILLAAATAGALGLGLKLYQNYLYFGDWKAVLQDTFPKVSERFSGNIENPYHVSEHAKKFIFRVFYLYGAIIFFVAATWYRIRKSLKLNVRMFLFLSLMGILSWQVLMREHSLNHLYLLCSALPILLMLTFYIAIVYCQRLGFKKREMLVWNIIAIIQGILLWAFALIPAIR